MRAVLQSMASRSARRPYTENMATITQQPRRSARNKGVGETNCEVTEDEAQVSPTSEEEFEVVDMSVNPLYCTSLAILW